LLLTKCLFITVNDELLLLFILWIDCGQDRPGLEFRQGREIFLFSKTSRPALGPTQPPIQRVLGLFPGRKAAMSWG
jgi:hypothetical protein